MQVLSNRIELNVFVSVRVFACVDDCLKLSAKKQKCVVSSDLMKERNLLVNHLYCS